MSTPTPVSDAVRLAWRRQSTWSRSADRIKTTISRARAIVLVCTVLGAFTATAATQVGAEHTTLTQVLAFTSAALLAMVPFALSRASSTSTQDWTRARSVSEAIKADVYTYLAGVHPFRGEDRDEVLLRRLDAVLDLAADIVNRTATIPVLDRPLPAVQDVASYAAVRVKGQITNYYQPKTMLVSRRLRQLRRVELILAIVAAVLAAAASLVPELGLTAWVGVMTTVSGIIAAHIGANQYEFQQTEYARTADQLERLLITLPDISDAESEDRFVSDCEHVISIQNEGWMAKLVQDDPPVELR